MMMLLLAYFSHPSAAEAFAIFSIPRSQWYVPAGINFGKSYPRNDLSEGDVPNGSDRWHFGGEISCVYLSREGYWGGFYADALGDSEGKRISAGAEFGNLLLGFDVGYLRIFNEERKNLHGASMRVMIATGYVSPYLHYASVKEGENYLEWGVLLKYVFLND